MNALPPHRRLATLALAACLGLAAAPLAAQTPIYQGDPFDRITLDAANDNQVLLVEPMDLPGRKVPENPKRNYKILVKLLDKPEPAYELEWSAVEQVEFWEDIILAEAKKLIAEGRRDEAYEHFAYMLQTYPDWPALKDALADYLYEEAKALARDKQFDASLAVLRELYGRKPDHAGLEKALGVTTDSLVKAYVAQGDYPSARALLDNLAPWYPQHETVAAWTARLSGEAGQFKAQAEAALAAGDLRAAHEAAREMLDRWPALAGGEELFGEISRKYPRVVVGVSAVAGPTADGTMNDWAARRAGRLVHRTLMEYVGPGPEGGVYRCPWGETSYDPLQRQLTIRLAPGTHWTDGGRLTGYDVSRRLLAMADPASPVFRPQWAELLARVAVREVYRVETQLQRPYVRPEALLQTRLAPVGPGGADAAEASLGAYLVQAASTTESVYVLGRHAAAAGAGQPREIVERVFADERDALLALERGHVQVLDRVSPWQVARLEQNKALAVGAYRVPLVHCLLPNVRKPLMASRAFRRAILYGIDRAAILNFLLGGQEVPGNRLLSGPFLAGMSFEDPLSYAYDSALEVRPYDPHLAIALANVGFKAVSEAEQKRGGKLAALPTLVLAHAPGAVARMACSEIRRQLGLLGLRVELSEREPAALQPIPADVDLVYAELALWEPVADARKLLAEDGMTGGCTPYMTLALRQLDEATQWDEVRDRLREIHRLAAEDAAVLPLWQLVDYFACDKRLQGLAGQPVSLYQDVEQWQAVLTPEGRAHEQ